MRAAVVARVVVLGVAVLLGACAQPSAGRIGATQSTQSAAQSEVAVPPVVAAIAAALREQLPPSYEVDLRFVPSESMTWPGVLGATWFDGVLHVEVSSDLCVQSMVDVLVHEWAHALRWNTAGCADPHDEVWGALFSRCYRVAVRAARAWRDPQTDSLPGQEKGAAALPAK